MTDSGGSGPKTTTRERRSIYGERTQFSLRLEPELRARVMDLCDEMRVSANNYIVALIEADLKKRKK